MITLCNKICCRGFDFRLHFEGKESGMKKFCWCMAVVILIPLLSSCATYVRPAPPPMQAEVIGVAPYANAVWVRGYWVWVHGGYLWVAGHWAPAVAPDQVEVVGVAPFRGAVWVRGHYGRFGVWHPGHWRAAY
jgi:hypothetical protein